MGLGGSVGIVIGTIIVMVGIVAKAKDSMGKSKYWKVGRVAYGTANAKIALIAVQRFKSSTFCSQNRKGLKMKDEIFKKWCSKCGVVTTTLSAKCCPDCGTGPLEDTGGSRYVKVIVKLPSSDDLLDYGLTTIEAYELYDYYMNHGTIKLSIEINGEYPKIKAVDGKPLEGD